MLNQGLKSRAPESGSNVGRGKSIEWQIDNYEKIDEEKSAIEGKRKYLSSTSYIKHLARHRSDWHQITK